jgi:HD-like signal output (HDOD) protein
MADTITDEIKLYRKLIKERIDSGNIRLPILPKVAGKVINLTNKSEINFAELSSLIQQDQILAGHVLKIANSPTYIGTTQVTTLQQAATRLGSKILAEITLSVSLKSDLFIVTGFERLIDELWNHSLATSLYGNEIAKIKNISSDTIFIVGLLHSVGMPMVLQLIAEFSSRHKIVNNNDITKRLIAEFSPVFTKIILKKWDLPEIIQFSIIHFNSFKTTKKYRDECALAYLANSLSVWMYDEKSFHASRLMNDPVLSFLDMDSSDMDELLEKKESILDNISNMSF